MSKNHQNQKNTVDPSKAIRNMGLGSSRKYSKNRFNRNVNIKEKMEPTEKLLNKTDEVHSTTNQNPSFLLIQSHSFAFEMPKQPIKHAKQPVGKRTSDSFRLNNIGHSATAQEKSVPISNEQLKTLPSYNNSEKWSSLASSSTFRPDHSSFMLRNETRRNALQENAYSSAIDSTVIDSGDSDNSEIGISGVKQLSCTTINDLNKTVVGSNQSSTTYKFQDLSNVSDDESVGSASALAHNTCIRMEKTCNELRKLNLNNRKLHIFLKTLIYLFNFHTKYISI